MLKGVLILRVVKGVEQTQSSNLVAPPYKGVLINTSWYRQIVIGVF